jgi:glycosyltransferase involved in cell wall biosynthesis
VSEGLHVIHVVLSLDFGGLERVVLGLVRGGIALGQHVDVVCLERPGTLAGQAEALGARVLCLNKPPGLCWELVRRLETLFAARRPDVVHTHQIGALLYAGPAARRAGVPAVVHTEHTNSAAHVRSLVRRVRMRLLTRVAGRHAGRFCCVSADIAAEYRAYRLVARRKLCVVPNGIDTDAFARPVSVGPIRRELGIPAAAPVVGTVGRLDEVKRQDRLLRAFAAVRRAVRDAHLLLVGDGPQKEPLRRLAAELGLSDCVHFAGYQSRPQRYLQLMRVFALTSRQEGMPLAILEAWATGLPVVATRVGGVPHLVSDGQTGILVDSGDEEALAAALIGLLTDGDRAARMGAVGRALVRERFGLTRMVETYQGHYRDVPARSGRALLCASSH